MFGRLIAILVVVALVVACGNNDKLVAECYEDHIAQPRDEGGCVGIVDAEAPGGVSRILGSGVPPACGGGMT